LSCKHLFTNTTTMNKTKVVTKIKGYKNTTWYKTIAPAETFVLADGKTVTNPMLCQTTDYDKFKVLDWNRWIEGSHGGSLIESYLKTKHVFTYPIIAQMKDGFYIVDGQHRVTSFKRLNTPHNPLIPLRFVMFKEDDMDVIMETAALLNNVSKRWTLKQYIKTYAKTNPHYQFLLEEHNRTKMQFRPLASIHAKQKIGTDMLKSGKFERKEVKGRAITKTNLIRFFQDHTTMVDDVYSTVALLDMITQYGIEYYVGIEKKFINKVNRVIKSRKLEGVSFGREKDYIEFFKECWM
jgi:hypothetical protein